MVSMQLQRLSRRPFSSPARRRKNLCIPIITFFLALLSIIHHLSSDRTTNLGDFVVSVKVEQRDNVQSPPSIFRVPATTATTGGVILTSWFIQKYDPQRRKFVSSTFDYVVNFYNSVRRWNLTAVIVHDHLSEDVVAQYETDRIVFYRIDWSNIQDERTKKYSTNDYRFVAYRNLLRNSENFHRAGDKVVAHQSKDDVHPSAESLLQNATHLLLSDVGDVYFQRDPFSVLQQRQQSDMLLSPDSGIYGEKSHSTWYIQDKLQQCVPHEDPSTTVEGAWKGQPVANAGVWGGTRVAVSCMLDCYNEQLNRMEDPSQNCNMLIHQYCVYNNNNCGSFRFETTSFVNPFRQECRNSSYAIIHNKCNRQDKNIICLAPQTLKVTKRRWWWQWLGQKSCPVDLPH